MRANLKWRGRSTALACATAALVSSAAPSLALASTPSELFYERALMSAAGARCNLFTPPIAAALAASAAQARGAALRQGTKEQDVAAVLSRAQSKAAAAACASGDIQKAAANVRGAFSAFAQQTQETYPGDLSRWTADKSSFGWQLSEPGAIGVNRMLIGFPSGAGLTAVVSFTDGLMPYGARLVLRDPGRTQGPYLNAAMAQPGGKLPYVARLAPANVTQSFLASTRSAAPASLLPAGATSGWRYGFPAAAAQALAGLDPREAVSVEFLFNSLGGVETRRVAYVEVGDFAAGRAFIAAAMN